MKIALTTIFAAAVASQASAQDVIHYWDFSATTDVVGAVTTTSVGTPDMSLHATYGEAYPGAGFSLNTILGGTSTGGGFLEADVFNGVSATALAFTSTQDFSFSYWCFDNSTDGDVKGARIMDSLEGTTSGIQLGTNAANVYNLRIDDDAGGSIVTNNTVAPYTTLTLPADVWTHVAVNISRTSGTLEAFIDGVSQGAISLGLSGGIVPTMDLQIGVINGGTVSGQAQESGLDDLAYYNGLLSSADAAGLAAGTLTPLDFLPCPLIGSSEVSRLGAPANPNVLLPGLTSGPVVGAIWDPVIDHTSFMPTAIQDIIGVGFAGAVNIPLAGMGTLLCDTFTVAPKFFFSAPSTPFAIGIPSDCALVGLSLCTQGISTDGINVGLTNALDITIGSF